jgi:hypothetical protein
MASLVKVELELPEAVSDEHRTTAQHRAHEAAVLFLWEAGEISTRDAASDLGLAYHEFLDLLTARGIPVVSGTFDVEALKKVQEARPGSRYRDVIGIGAGPADLSQRTGETFVAVLEERAQRATDADGHLD